MIPFNLFEWHHLYLGLFLLISSITIMFIRGKHKEGKFDAWAISLFLAGFIITLDDIVYHAYGRSLLHSLYSYLYWEYEWIRDINKWFDNLFGKG